MKEIHLGPILTENRRKVGITQEDLARFLGVSKAAVSKWETGSAYPDILMLPRLASFFNITIDQAHGIPTQADSGRNTADLYGSCKRIYSTSIWKSSGTLPGIYKRIQFLLSPSFSNGYPFYQPYFSVSIF